MRLAEKILIGLKESLTKSQLQDISGELDSMKSLGPDGQDPSELSISGGSFTISKSFRNYSLFDARDGEEDDDNPIFSGREKALSIVKNRLGKFKGIKIEVWDNEKSWFTVRVVGKYDDSQETLPIEKKQISFLSRSEVWEWIDKFLPTILQPQLSKIGKTLNNKALKLEPFSIEKTYSGSTSYNTVIPMGTLLTQGSKSGHVRAITGKANFQVREGVIKVSIYPSDSQPKYAQPYPTMISLSPLTPERLHSIELKSGKATLENAAKELLKCAKAWDKKSKEILIELKEKGREPIKRKEGGFMLVGEGKV
jgi:hypothetical protein